MRAAPHHALPPLAHTQTPTHGHTYPLSLNKFSLTGKIRKTESAGGAKKLGVLDDYSMPPGLLGELQGKLNLSPNEVMFAQRDVRQGILPRMLTEILEARIQVKKDLKKTTDKVLHRILNAKQYALKLIANVTYGYTSASFSGRMPCVDIADAIVAYGRQALERALKQIESNSEWGAKVRYGDTDSLFVELPGRSKEEAFRIGAEMERAVNAVNPRPVELELEKVYHPCILLSKKRYVGYSWESASQTEPVFDAKGIETIRRDSCPLVAKMEDRALRMLFESKDLSAIKSYCQRQWAKLLLQRVSVADLVFRKEVKLGSYRSETNIPPAACVATRQIANDPMAVRRSLLDSTQNRRLRGWFAGRCHHTASVSLMLSSISLLAHHYATCAWRLKLCLSPARCASTPPTTLRNALCPRSADCSTLWGPMWRAGGSPCRGSTKRH